MRIDLRRWVGMLWCLILLLFVAACAPGSGSTSGSPSASPTATPAPGSPELNGCLAQKPPAGVDSRPADVVVTQGGGIDGQPVMLRKGQTLEVRLPATWRWHLHIQDVGHSLTTDAATGWYDGSLKACLWRFTAVGAGNATLTYTGGLVCAPNTPCPAIAALQQYNVAIS